MTTSPNYPNPTALDEPSSPEAPGSVVAAFWLYLLSAVVGIVGAVLAMANRQSITDAARQANQDSGGKLTETQIDQGVTIIIVGALVFAVVVALLYLLFAFKLKAGRNWARVVLTILTVLSVIALFVTKGTTAITYVGDAAAVIATVMAFLPRSNAYFAAAKRVRR
jgi:hypothetical protein